MLPPIRIGNGMDVHAFCADRPLILGGIHIPYEYGLAGHSDADVLIHAVMDALLGALALGDIGDHFPDTDARYKGIDSSLLLEHVCALVEKQNWSIGNIDSTLVMQKPKIAPYRETIRQNLARLLRISPNCVSLKATTTEHLGFTGRSEGVCAFSTVLLFQNEQKD